MVANPSPGLTMVSYPYIELIDPPQAHRHQSSSGLTQVTFTLPPSLPSGQYLVRAEQIALHVAQSFGGAQFYISCAQINVANGGSGTPGPLVSIPGVYTGNEPGILISKFMLIFDPCAEADSRTTNIDIYSPIVSTHPSHPWYAILDGSID